MVSTAEAATTGQLPEESTTLTMHSKAMTALAVDALEALKGSDIVVMDIADRSSIADAMLVVTGSSLRHVGALAEEVRLRAKQAGYPPLGIEGGENSDWTLVDLGDVIVHVMTQERRDFYALEKLWSVGPEQDDQRSGVAGSA